ncbi:hypothetical protein [Bifidobacterium saguinibicoloris]|uniref:hypothetical protein n=1 Tax=Bifidobacterium saguinibicoloris TaxID=2834433 RepID=UPI001C56824E|nr:hypothetical protein [Bifidobacterium saguinibicoloris]MBW3080456.1 hypothetical protein [Bifidobacterium saguinibicoloris]
MADYHNDDGSTGITQKRLRNILFDRYGERISASTLYRWIHLGEHDGDTAFPRYDYLLMLSDTFGVSVAYLTGEDDGTTPAEDKAAAYTGLSTKAIGNLHRHNISADENVREALSEFLEQRHTISRFAAQLAWHINSMKLIRVMTLMLPQGLFIPQQNAELHHLAADLTNLMPDTDFDMFDIFLEASRHKVIASFEGILDALEHPIDELYQNALDAERQGQDVRQKTRDMYADTGLTEKMDEWQAFMEHMNGHDTSPSPDVGAT